MPKISSILIVIFLIYQAVCFADIPSPNAGEQAMINNLRLVIDKDPYLKSRNIVIGAGGSGCDSFKKSVPGNINVLLTWQWLDAMKSLAKGTIIVVPEHAIDENFDSIKDKITLIKINGVLHTRTLENIQHENTKPVKDINPELIVMLAGDVQAEDGSWVLYTKEMAAILLQDLPSDKRILFLNGPRTGKHKIIQGKVIIDETAHRTTTDNLTRFVMNSSRNKPWAVVDFKFQENSLWGPTLKFCLESPKIVLILPGESISMISEALALGIRPVIYEHKAMTKASRRYVSDLVKKGRAVLYPDLDSKERYRQTPEPLQEDKIIEALRGILTDKPL